jgi:hypothetical protein
VVMINSGSQCNVFWQVGSSATLGTSTSFAGNILALTSITATTGANIVGRALARNGAVTLDTNNITPSSCTPVPALPPWGFLLLAMMLATSGAVMLRRRSATT